MVIGGDNMLKKRLTNKQMDVMNILWENDKPMAASEILKANEKLNINTIHACIRKLLEEEYVKVAYIDYSGNVMSRYFVPTVSKGKYFSESYKDIIGSKKLILTSLIETETNIEELEQLENLIRKKKEELNIMANIKIIEELKANLLCIIGEFFSLLTKGTNIAQDAILNCISGAILILYVLAQKLGYSCAEVDDDMRKKLKLGIAEEHEYEKEGKSLSKLQKHIRERY